MRLICIQLVIGVMVLLANVCLAQSDFRLLQTAIDSSYGYSEKNPVGLKNGNVKRSEVNIRKFLNGLQSKDGQKLIVHERYVYAGGKKKFPDKVVLITAISKDTVTLFVDAHKSGKLMLPVGLRWE